MKSLSSVGLGLSIVFGCLLLALLAEVYYLLWWKKRLTTNRDIENDYSNPAREFLFLFCWKRSSTSSSSSSMSQTTALNPQGISSSNLLLKPADFENNNHNHNHELMRLHGINSGPPRFLFTIIEETKEDLESEEAKSKCGDIKSRVGSRGRSLSDLLLSVETPYLTPLASPPFFTPPLTPMEASSGCCTSNYSHQLGFNPLFESATDAEFNRIKSSPPPKFKFLQEAEEKQRKKMMEEEEEEEDDDDDDVMTPPSKYLKDEEDGSFITIIVDRSKEIRGFNQQCHSSAAASSQVLPLSSSPSTLIKSPARNLITSI